MQSTNGVVRHEPQFFTVAPGVWGMKDILVNFYMIEDRDTGNWVLVDAGLKTSAPKIRQMATELFGWGSRPEAIVLTHGHFDHVGSLIRLAEEWDVPVYAHRLERPYLSGMSEYPPPDPTVGGGLLALLSFLFPKKPIQVEDRLRLLPADGTVPGLRGWRYIHTPGHSPGHVSLFRKEDKVLIAGDAFCTTKQESLLSVLSQKVKLTGPPKYFTCDWESAADSVRRLADLEPNVVAAGHGQPLEGVAMQKALRKLAKNFWKRAAPKHGRYLEQPAITDESGVLYVPPAAPLPLPNVPRAVALAGLAALAVVFVMDVFQTNSASKNSGLPVGSGQF